MLQKELTKEQLTVCKAVLAVHATNVLLACTAVESTNHCV